MTKRDFFLPAPNPSLHGIVRRLASYAMASTMSHALASVLKTRFEGGTVRLLAEGVAVCWTEHSERATLRSWARTSGIPEDVCKRLGRWTPTVDQSYDRTVRATILRAQASMAMFVRGSLGRADPFDEGLVLQKVATTMEELGYYSGEIRLQIEKLTSYIPVGPAAKKIRWTPLQDEWDIDDGDGFEESDGNQSFGDRPKTPEVESVQGDEDDNSPVHVEAEAVQQPPFGTYMVSIVGRSRKRTLHRMGECHRKPGAHFGRFEVLGSDLPSSVEYHRACKICFPLGLNQSDEISGDESSSGDASSSDSGSEEDSWACESDHKSKVPCLQVGGACKLRSATCSLDLWLVVHEIHELHVGLPCCRFVSCRVGKKMKSHSFPPSFLFHLWSVIFHRLSDVLQWSISETDAVHVKWTKRRVDGGYRPWHGRA